MNKMEIRNRKGQELSIGTLVLIVLGVIVLVLLVLGFSIGWKNLFSKVGIASGSDVSALVSSCRLAAASDSKTSYCEFKKATIDGETVEVNCEYKAIEEDLGGDALSGVCSKSITDQYKGVTTVIGRRMMDVKKTCMALGGSKKDVCGSGETEIKDISDPTVGKVCCKAGS